MFQFISENILLLLTIFGAVVSFLASFIGLISKKKPVWILAVLAVLGFSVGIAYQIYAYNQKQASSLISKAAQQARDNVVDEINQNVKETKITVDSIAKKLSKATLREVATELVTIRTSGPIHLEEAISFAKSPPNMWNKYTQWLTSVDKTSGSPSLSLLVNGGHHYDSGLLLAYLLNSNTTSDDLKSITSKHSSWHTFPADTFYLKAFTPDTSHIQWVLFIDANTKLPVAYANAQLFVQELMIYHRLKQHEKINTMLNTRGTNAIAQLRKSFPSIQTDVFETDSPAELAKLMIDRQLAAAVTFADKRPYMVKLVRLIHLAAQKE